MLMHERRLSLIDGDTVEVRNLDRQWFSTPDIGRYKAEALAMRLEAEYGIKIKTSNVYVDDATTMRDFNKVILLAVDNHRARAKVYELVDNAYNHNGVVVIDCANELESATASIYLPEWRGTEHDPRSQFPEINVDNRADDPTKLSCAAKVSSGEQSAFANMSAACLGISLLRTWIDRDMLHAEETVRNSIPYQHTMNPSHWRSLV